MVYILEKWQLISIPVPDPDGNWIVVLNCFIKIENELKGFVKIDELSYIIDKTKTIEQATAWLTEQCVIYIDNNYNN